MLVLSDLEDIFVPLQDGLFVDVQESRCAHSCIIYVDALSYSLRALITNLLTSLGDASTRPLETEAALGSALATCLAALVRSAIWRISADTESLRLGKAAKCSLSLPSFLQLAWAL